MSTFKSAIAISPVMLLAAELAAYQLPLSCAATPSAQLRINPEPAPQYRSFHPLSMTSVHGLPQPPASPQIAESRKLGAAAARKRRRRTHTAATQSPTGKAMDPAMLPYSLVPWFPLSLVPCFMSSAPRAATAFPESLASHPRRRRFFRTVCSSALRAAHTDEAARADCAAALCPPAHAQ